MIELADIIRIRVDQQINTASRRVPDAVNQALWLYGIHGLNARKRSAHSSWKKFVSREAVTAPINGINRYLTKLSAELLYQGYQRPSQDASFIEFIANHSGVSKEKLVTEFGSPRKVNSKLRKAQTNWNIFRINQSYWTGESLFEMKSHEFIVKQILNRYNYLTLDQLEFLTGIARFKLLRPITKLVEKGEITRMITRKDSPDELFVSKEYREFNDGWEFPTFVIEHRDPLAEIIRLERGFAHSNGDLWLFVHGLPQAEFTLQKENGRNNYSIKGLRRFVTTTLTIKQILEKIQDWGKATRKSILVSSEDDPVTQFVVSATQQLLERGYGWDSTALLLTKTSTTNQTASTPKIVSDRITRQQAGLWSRNAQLIKFTGTADDLVSLLGPLESVESIAYRLNLSPTDIEFNRVIYTSGINYRMSYIHPDHLTYIVKGWPRQPNIGYVDNKIIALLEQPTSTKEIIATLVNNPSKIYQRLRYLEQMRVIRRVLPDVEDFNDRKWVRFKHQIEEEIPAVVPHPHMSAVGNLIITILNRNPPLSLTQLSRFTGIKESKVKELMVKLTRDGVIIEGYFMEDTTTKEYTTPDVLDSIATDFEDDRSAFSEIDILPIQDTFSRLHLPQLVVQDSSIQITTPPSRNSEQWMIMWQGNPCGYFIKSPTSHQLVDYELELYISRSFVKNPIIAGSLQRIVSLYRTWYKEEGILMYINHRRPSKYEELHFLMDSIGITYQQED